MQVAVSYAKKYRVTQKNFIKKTQSKMTNSLKKYSQAPNTLALLVVTDILNHICVKLKEKMFKLCVTLYFFFVFLIV